jgi:hypothetical protein
MKRYAQATGGDMEEYEEGEWVRYEEAFPASPYLQLVDLWMANAILCEGQADEARRAGDRDCEVSNLQAAKTFRACAYALESRLPANKQNERP